MDSVIRWIKALVLNMLHKHGYCLVSSSKMPAYPSGHYYCTIPANEEILKREDWIFRSFKNEIVGINLREKEQLELLGNIKKYYNEIPFTDDKKKGQRYFYNNSFYSYSDAIFLYSVMRYFNPKKIIEIGSGFSSGVMLDTNELFLDGKCTCYFIEPYPEQLLSVMVEKDQAANKVIKDYVQDVDINIFKQLEENDILFIDSSHVAKTGSDVNRIFFEILPSLNKGVLIHFHDIFYPFEYPKEWVLARRSWNEDYMLHAFLQYNSNFEIILFNTFLEHYHKEWFSENMPLCLRNTGGSIWLKKL